MATDRTLRPSWVIKREKRIEQDNLQAKLSATRIRLAEVLIQKDSAQYCRDFVSGLPFNLGFVDGFTSTIKQTPTQDNGPQLYTLVLRENGNLYRSISLSIQFDLPTAKTIRVHPVSPEGLKDWQIILTPLPSEDGIGGILAGSEQIMPLDAVRLAEIVAEDIVKTIDPR